MVLAGRGAAAADSTPLKIDQRELLEDASKHIAAKPAETTESSAKQ